MNIKMRFKSLHGILSEDSFGEDIIISPLIHAFLRISWSYCVTKNLIYLHTSTKKCIHFSSEIFRGGYAKWAF